MKYILLMLLYILILIIGCRYGRINYQMIKSIKILKDYQAEIGCVELDRVLHICIPCLREQSIIEHTLDELIKVTDSIRNNVKIYVVTTEKENYDKERYRGKIKEFTQQLLKGETEERLSRKYGYLFSSNEIEEIYDYVSKNRERDKHTIQLYVSECYNKKLSTYEVVYRYIEKHYETNIVLLHYPKAICSMAAQLNYGYQWIIENNTNNKNDYFMVYNADCQPNPNTFKLLLKKMMENRDVNVFQLIRAYTLNYESYSGMKGLFLKASALYQTRWSLGFEYPMYEKYYKKYSPENQNSYYMIGHGMTFSLKLLETVNGFHETTNLEDLYMGYVLSYFRENVIAIPVLENTLNPLTISSWAKQKMVWFGGMHDVYKYPSYLKKNSPDFFNMRWSKKLELQFWVRDTLPWLLGPTSVIVLIMLSLIISKEIFLGVLALIFINDFLCAYYLPKQLIKLGVLAENVDDNVGGTIVGVFIYSIFRNIPSIYYLLNMVFNKSMEKFKTER